MKIYGIYYKEENDWDSFDVFCDFHATRESAEMSLRQKAEEFFQKEIDETEKSIKWWKKLVPLHEEIYKCLTEGKLVKAYESMIHNNDDEFISCNGIDERYKFELDEDLDENRIYRIEYLDKVLRGDFAIKTIKGKTKVSDVKRNLLSEVNKIKGYLKDDSEKLKDWKENKEKYLKYVVKRYGIKELEVRNITESISDSVK